MITKEQFIQMIGNLPDSVPTDNDLMYERYKVQLQKQIYALAYKQMNQQMAMANQLGQGNNPQGQGGLISGYGAYPYPAQGRQAQNIYRDNKMLVTHAYNELYAALQTLRHSGIPEDMRDRLVKDLSNFIFELQSLEYKHDP